MKSKKTWKDITVAKAMELMTLDENDMDALDFVIEQLSILEDRDTDEIENQEPAKIFSDIEKWSFMKETPKAKLIPYTKIDGKEYGVTPLDKITLAQMVDIEEHYKNGLEQNLDKIASILVLPVAEKSLFGKRKLAEYEYDEDRVEDMRKLDMEFVWSNMVFFWNGEREYMNDFLDFFKTRMEQTETTTMPSWKSMTEEYRKMLVERQSQTRKGKQART